MEGATTEKHGVEQARAGRDLWASLAVATCRRRVRRLGTHLPRAAARHDRHRGLSASLYSGHLFLGGGTGFTPPPKKTYSSPKRLPNCALNIFFGRDNELQIYHGIFLLIIDNKHRKLIVIKQSKRCKFMPKMHQNTIGGAPSVGLFTSWKSNTAAGRRFGKPLNRGVSATIWPIFVKFGMMQIGAPSRCIHYLICHICANCSSNCLQLMDWIELQTTVPPRTGLRKLRCEQPH